MSRRVVTIGRAPTEWATAFPLAAGRSVFVPAVSGMTAVAICALTLHRPRGLDALLGSLAGLDDPGAAFDVKVVIVDNDGDGSAEAVVDRWRPEFPWELVYVVEARPGIPCGRNAAIRAAGAVDFIAFLDDDETADPNWLADSCASSAPPAPTS